ncbi:hypothetical protein TNCV_3777541 [Trichonephila clavipes]|nr:hypothetical protein TNCV_3777541 [Trichonephila clavipes]
MRSCVFHPTLPEEPFSTSERVQRGEGGCSLRDYNRSEDLIAISTTGQSSNLNDVEINAPTNGDIATPAALRPGRLNCTQQSKTATAGSDVVQSGRPIFDDFFQHLWPYIGNNTANVVFQMVKRLLLIRIDQ